jgi:phosphate:Na+ symporter
VEVAKLLFLIGEFERITDYAMEITYSAREMFDKKMQFSSQAKFEMGVMTSAVEEVVETAVKAFCDNNVSLATKVDPLEEVIDGLKSSMKKQHIVRLQRNDCKIELGFVFLDLITILERISDHCSNIAGCLIEMSHDSMNMHKYLYKVKHEPNNEFTEQFKKYQEKYSIG